MLATRNEHLAKADEKNFRVQRNEKKKPVFGRAGTAPAAALAEAADALEAAVPEAVPEPDTPVEEKRGSAAPHEEMVP
eukprot:Skav235827  [mRNA]  locus=scaffold1931:96363:105779:- [translate_table: standard]